MNNYYKRDPESVPRSSSGCNGGIMKLVSLGAYESPKCEKVGLVKQSNFCSILPDENEKNSELTQILIESKMVIPVEKLEPKNVDKMTKVFVCGFWIGSANRRTDVVYLCNSGLMNDYLDMNNFQMIVNKTDNEVYFHSKIKTDEISGRDDK